MQDNTLSFEEFEEKLWSYISKELVSNRDIEDNLDWANTIAHDAWRIHTHSNVPYNVVMKNVEQMISAYKRFAPVLGVHRKR